MILKGIQVSVDAFGLFQTHTLEEQPPGTPRIVPPDYNEINAGVLLTELAARQRAHGIAPSALELSVLTTMLGATVTPGGGGQILLDEGTLHDLIRSALAL